MVNPEIVERVLKEFYVGEATTPSKYQIPLSISDYPMSLFYSLSLSGLRDLTLYI